MTACWRLAVMFSVWVISISRWRKFLIFIIFNFIQYIQSSILMHFLEKKGAKNVFINKIGTIWNKSDATTYSWNTIDVIRQKRVNTPTELSKINRDDTAILRECDSNRHTHTQINTQMFVFVHWTHGRCYVAWIKWIMKWNEMDVMFVEFVIYKIHENPNSFTRNWHQNDK